MHGKLNNIGMMHEFLLGYRYHLSKLLAAFGGEETESRIITEKLKADLRIWRTGQEAAEAGLPIAEPPTGPLVTALKFTSDAAGAAFSWWNDMRVNCNKPGDRRVAAVGFKDGKIWFGAEYRLPYSLLTRDRDVAGREFSSKSATLEPVGLLLPIVTGPELVRDQQMRFAVDNINLIYG